MFKKSMDSVAYVKFEKACEIGDLETVMKLFDDVKHDVDILEMRNFAAVKGNLNILEFFYQRGIDLHDFYNHSTPFIIAASRGWVLI